MKASKLLLFLISFLIPSAAFSVTLSLERTIELANDSSLMAFRYRNIPVELLAVCELSSRTVAEPLAVAYACKLQQVYDTTL